MDCQTAAPKDIRSAESLDRSKAMRWVEKKEIRKDGL
jgi:hypothetical protein